MAQTLYTHELRILACQRCGAPLDAAVSGGALACTYCGAANRFAGRDETTDRQEVERARDAIISESERFARLRAQDRAPEPLPDSIEAMLVDDGLPLSRLPEAEEEWRRARAQLEERPSFPLSERLFHLTVLIAPLLEGRRQRAILETATELLVDARHRSVLRCMLARLAARAGDVTAAREWLALCNGRSVDLLMDTAYRFAAATLAIVERRFGDVTELLGTRAGDVPLANRDELACDVLRVHALAQLGDREAALNEMTEWIERMRGDGVRRLLAQHAPLRLAEDLLVEAERRLADAAGKERRQLQRAGIEQLRAKLEVAERSWLRLRIVVVVAVMTPVFSVLIGSVWSCIVTGMIEQDPLFGAHADLLCPRICEGCTGPYRHASWTTTTNMTDSTTTHDIYCQDPEGRIASMEQSVFWLQAVSSPGWLERYEVPGGTWYITGTVIVLFLPLGLGASLFLVAQGYRSRRALRRELRESLARAEAALASS